MGRDGLLPVFGGLVLLVSATLWQVNFYAWSEAPFLLCLQGSALALLRHVESGTRGTFVAAVALAAMALLFRYAGIAWVGAAALTLLLLQISSIPSLREIHARHVRGQAKRGVDRFSSPATTLHLL